MPSILVTGAARSGKSEWAEALAAQSNRSVVYVATAQTSDTDVEWQARIAAHQQRRPPTWSLLEVPIALSATLRSAAPTECLLVDSLGTWTANLLEQDDRQWETTVSELLNALNHTAAQTILVAEETGWGVVPAYPIGRLFRDRLGALTRQIGTIASPVYLVVAGHVLNLSQIGMPLTTLCQNLNMATDLSPLAEEEHL